MPDIYLKIVFLLNVFLFCRLLKNGRTPLHYCAKNGHSRVLSLLLESGAESQFGDDVSDILDINSKGYCYCEINFAMGS